MTDTILDTIVSLLNAKGLDAQRSFGNFALPSTKPRVCVSLKRSALLSSGAGDYLGETFDNGLARELYGYRCEAVISLDIYAPYTQDGAAECSAVAASIVHIMADAPASFKHRSTLCDAVSYDRDLRLYHLHTELDCLFFLLRELDQETGQFLDFKLKGDIS